MSQGHRVLVMDGWSEIQEVLQAVLEPRGLQVRRMETHVAGRSTETGLPDIVVIDAEAVPLGRNLGAEWAGVPQVIISSRRIPRTVSEPGRHYLHKPFQYGELIEAIEQMLPDTDAA